MQKNSRQSSTVTVSGWQGKREASARFNPLVVGSILKIALAKPLCAVSKVLGTVSAEANILQDGGFGKAGPKVRKSPPKSRILGGLRTFLEQGRPAQKKSQVKVGEKTAPQGSKVESSKNSCGETPDGTFADSFGGQGCGVKRAKTPFSSAFGKMFNGTEVRKSAGARKKAGPAGMLLGPDGPFRASCAEEVEADLVSFPPRDLLKVHAHLRDQLRLKLALEDRILDPLSIILEDLRDAVARPVILNIITHHNEHGTSHPHYRLTTTNTAPPILTIDSRKRTRHLPSSTGAVTDHRQQGSRGTTRNCQHFHSFLLRTTTRHHQPQMARALREMRAKAFSLLTTTSRHQRLMKGRYLPPPSR